MRVVLELQQQRPVSLVARVNGADVVTKSGPNVSTQTLEAVVTATAGQYVEVWANPNGIGFARTSSTLSLIRLGA